MLQKNKTKQNILANGLWSLYVTMVDFSIRLCWSLLSNVAPYPHLATNVRDDIRYYASPFLQWVTAYISTDLCWSLEFYFIVSEIDFYFLSRSCLKIFLSVKKQTSDCDEHVDCSSQLCIATVLQLWYQPAYNHAYQTVLIWSQEAGMETPMVFLQYSWQTKAVGTIPL